MERIDSDTLRLRDMLNAIADVEQFSPIDFTNRQQLFACAYAIAIIGEAAGKVSAPLRDAYPLVPWAEITGMRHRIIHGYGTLNIDRLGEVIRTHLPRLKRDLEKILAEHYR